MRYHVSYTCGTTHRTVVTYILICAYWEIGDAVTEYFELNASIANIS
jgi:hypothetical protein